MTSLVSVARSRIETLCRALPGGPTLSEVEPVVEAMMQGWGERSISAPPFPSHIGDDHSPFEFSLAFAAGSAPELRLLVEAQAEGVGQTLEATRAAGLRLNDYLAERYQLSLERFDRVRDLFLPERAEGAFSIWHAVCMWKGRAPEFKLYLNPQSQGEKEGRVVVRLALERLGLGSCADDLFGRGGFRGPDLDEIRYFSLDLSRTGRSRVKVYYRHHEATAADLERAFSFVASHRPGDVSGFLGRMAPGVRRFSAKPVGSCFGYVEGSERPVAATLHLPIAHYAESDRVTAERVAAELQGTDAGSAYVEMMSRFAGRPLAEGAGLQSYTSFRREAGGLRTTIYVSPEVYEPSMFGGVARALPTLSQGGQANDNLHSISKIA